MPSVQFVTTADGVRIAYSLHGAGPPMVVSRGWFSHLELMWANPGVRAWFEAVGRVRTVVRFDCRGNGLSDRDVEPTLDGLVADIEAVAGTLDDGPFALYGMGYGGPAAIAFAVRHPSRVSELVLFGTFASGLRAGDPQGWETFLKQLRESPDTALITLSSLGAPHAPLMPAETIRRLRQTVDPDMARALYEVALEVDLSGELASVTAPTLVLHQRQAVAIPVRFGRDLAAGIPDARFVALDGSSFNPWQGDVAGGLRELAELLGVPIEPPGGGGAEPDSMTILFTDMESSTALTQELGDDQAQRLVREHNDAVRAALRQTGGREVKHTGDGILATFSSATRALECAVEIQRRMAGSGSGLRVRVGLNAGEPLEEDDDLFGAAVQVASRITDVAAPGQILVADVVRQLAAGKGFGFADHGRVELRGIREKVALFELIWTQD